MTADAVVQLAPDEVVEGRPFTATLHTERDTAVMRDMLAHMRSRARRWRGSGALVREVDAAGLRTWIRVPDRTALFAAGYATLWRLARDVRNSGEARACRSVV